MSGSGAAHILTLFLGQLGDCLPSACLARYLCIKSPGSSPKFILT